MIYGRKIFRDNEVTRHMGFFIAMFICNLLIPVIMLIGGYCMYKNPPKEINGLVGYRTTMSKKNNDTWSVAHEYCGRLWMKLGLMLLIPSIIVQIPFVHSDDDAIVIVTLIIETIQLVVLIGSIVSVEKALKRTFDENGIRR